MSNQQTTQTQQITQGQGFNLTSMDCAAAAADRFFIEMLFSALGDNPAEAIINRYGKDIVKCFADEAPRAIYSTMVNLAEQQSSIDIVTLTSALRENKKLEVPGVQTFIDGLETNIVNSLSREQRIRIADEKLKIIQGYWRIRESRKFIGTANRLINRADINNPDRIMQYLSVGVDRYHQAFEAIDEEDDMFMEVLADGEKQLNGECVTPCISSGFKSLDDYLEGGFEPQQLYLIGGRPSMGKSVIGGNIAIAAAKQGKRVIYFSLEMNHKLIARRLISAEAGIEFTKIKNLLLANEEERALFMKTARNLSKIKNNIKVVDTPNRSIEDITSLVRKEKALKGVDLVVIDHIHLIASRKNSENRTNEIRQIAGGLLALTKSADIPVVALAQLNRETTATMTKMPNLSNLKDGGALEENADVVIMLHRPAYYHDPMSEKEPPPKELAIIAVQKNRSGKTGNFEMRFEAEYSRFVEAPTNNTIFQQWLQPSRKNDNDPELDIPNGFDLFESVANNY